VKALFDSQPVGEVDLQIVDIYKRPDLASARQIIAVPTLIRQDPLPERRVIGTMEDRKRVLTALNIVLKPLANEPH
jgi:circadian clock protein KaiB